MDKKTKTTKKNKTNENDIRCGCAIGDLSEFAPVKPAKNTDTKKLKKILKKDDSKKENSNNH